MQKSNKLRNTDIKVSTEWGPSFCI